MIKVAIIGAGAYGSYTASLICELHKDWEVHIYEVGDQNIRSQDEIGFRSEVVNGHYGGLTKGRYFGYGGATAKWGGQILTFSDNDFKSPTNYQKEIVELNKKYKQNIFRKVGIENNYREERLENGMFTKTGVWLDYFSRNLFKKFKVSKNKNVTLYPHHRVCKLNIEDKRVVSFEALVEGQEKVIDGYDWYFLAAGAFETTRILMMSEQQDKTGVMFSDHINKKVFKINADPNLGPVDFTFHIKNASFITQRVIGEKDGIPFFIYPTYNENFPFFQNLKKLLFGKKLTPMLAWSVIKDFPSFACFIWNFFVLRKLYVYKPWYLVLHIENLPGNGHVRLSEFVDKFKQPGIEMDFYVTPQAERLFNELADELAKLLDQWGVDYERVEDDVQTEKFEDEYHPCSLYSEFDSVNDYFSQYQNLLVIHSGVLPHAGGINSTAAAFPLIEEYVRCKMNKQS